MEIEWGSSNLFITKNKYIIKNVLLLSDTFFFCKEFLITELKYTVNLSKVSYRNKIDLQRIIIILFYFQKPHNINIRKSKRIVKD